MVGNRYELDDLQWQRIAPLLPGKLSDRGRTGSNNRIFVDGCLWVLQSGAHWYDLSERYGRWKSLHRRFSHWCHAGVWEKFFERLAADHDNQYLMVDTTIVRAHQQAASGKEGGNQALGRSRGGLTTKIHRLADMLSRPIRFIFTAGQTRDITTAPALLDGFHGKAVLADKAYDSNALRHVIDSMGAEAVIPSNRTRKSSSRTMPMSKNSAIESNGASQSSNTFGVSPNATNGEFKTSPVSPTLPQP